MSTVSTRTLRVDQRLHQPAGGSETGTPSLGTAADLAFEIVGDTTAAGVDVATVFAQVAARMGQSVWMGYVGDGRRSGCRVRVGRGPVYSGGDGASLGLVFDAALLRSRLAAGAFQPGGLLLLDAPGEGASASEACNPSHWGSLPVRLVPLRALASRVPAFPQGERIVALGLLARLFDHDPAEVRRALENRFAPGGRRTVSAALRLFELGWRDAALFLPLPLAAAAPGTVLADRIEVMSGREALAMGALTAGFTCCVANTEHPALDRWAETYRALGGRVFSRWEARMARARAVACDRRTCPVREGGAARPGRGYAASGPVLMVDVAGGPANLEERALDPEAVACPVAASDGPRVIVRIERAPRADALLFPFGSDPLSAAAGCPGGPRPVVLAPTTVEECYHFVGLARQLADQYRCDCFVLVDAALLGAVQAWPRRSGADVWGGWLSAAALAPRAAGAGWDRATDSGSDGVPGEACVDRLLAQLGIAAAPVDRFVQAPRPVGGDAGELLLVGWGMTRGPVEEAALRLRAQGVAVSALHLRCLSPLPPGLGRVLAAFRRVVAVDVQEDQQASSRRLGQLVHLLRAALADIAPKEGAAGKPQLGAHRFARGQFLGPAAVQAWAAAQLHERPPMSTFSSPSDLPA